MTIRCTDPSAQNVESALGSGAGGSGSAHALAPHLSHPPTPTAHPGCGWAAGPSVCLFCCSSAPRWGSCTPGPGKPRTSGYLFRCGRPCRVPPGQSCRTSPLSPAMPTSPSGSRSKWWGECQEGWPQCVTHSGWGGGGALLFSPLLRSDAWVSPAGWLVMGVRWEVEGAIESWPGGRGGICPP